MVTTIHIDFIRLAKIAVGNVKISVVKKFFVFKISSFNQDENFMHF